MGKSVRRPPRRRRAQSALIAADARAPRELVDQILNTPHLARVVPRLQPEVLHRLIEHCGLEDCGDLVALATPDQLARVFDLDLWRPDAPGHDAQFDAERFGLWLEVMVESGVEGAARTLAAMDAGLVSGSLAQHVRVFDVAAVAPFTTLDGEEISVPHAMDDSVRCDVGGYAVVAWRTRFWESITTLLTALEETHRDYFDQVMRGCRRVSNSRPEVDGLDDLLDVGDQAMFDLAIEREQRRDSEGFVTPAEARAFLQRSRHVDLRHGRTRPPNPIARAHFRDLNTQTATVADSDIDLLPAARGPQEDPDVSADAVVEVVDLLQQAGVLPRDPRALLDRPRGDAPRLSPIQARLQFVRDSDPDAFSTRSGELAFLANAIVAGSSVQARPIAAAEASTAVVAVCNLGLENWPLHWLAGESRHRPSDGDSGAALPHDFLVEHDLVSVFEVGWTVLHENVCMYAAERLIDVLTSFQCEDRATQAGLDTLRMTMTRHWRQGTPWRALEALDVIAILDIPAWAALLALTGEFPVLHAVIPASLAGHAGQVSASAFEFISENSQIAVVHHFMQSLAERLR
jgi:Family of unknown function (DUF6178)